MKRPQLPTADVLAVIAANRVPEEYQICVVAVRGYLLNSKGKRGVNDRRCYDDAHFIVNRRTNKVYRFYGNVDPNGYREGQGTGKGKGMASLRTGIHLYGPGIHRKWRAFRQAEIFTVIRDGFNGPYKDATQIHAINWHPGGGWLDTWGNTWSLGCQTNPKKIFLELRDLLYELLWQSTNPRGLTDRPWPTKTSKVPLLPYILIDEVDRQKGELVVSSRYGASLQPRLL